MAKNTFLKKNQINIILSLQYFLFFGVMGLVLPYFNLYCYHLNFNGVQIGYISSIKSFCMIFFPVTWSIIADHFQIRKLLYVICNFIASALCILYIYITSFWGILLLTLCYTIFYAPLISFLEAFSMDILGDNKKKYGNIRVWGSISFIIVVLIMGKIIDIYSIHIIFYLIFAGSFIQAVFSIFIKNISKTKSLNEPYFKNIDLLYKKEIIIFLFCGFIMLLSHGTYYGFSSIHLENLGYSRSYIGIYWALGSTSEILVMIYSQKILNKFDLKTLLKFSLFCAIIRWSILFYTKSGIIIICSQILHAATYGCFHIASIIYIDSLVPNQAKTIAQAVNNSVTYGLGIMTGFFINGYLFETIGSNNSFLFSACIAFIGFVVLHLTSINNVTK